MRFRAVFIHYLLPLSLFRQNVLSNSYRFWFFFDHFGFLFASLCTGYSDWSASLYYLDRHYVQPRQLTLLTARSFKEAAWRLSGKTHSQTMSTRWRHALEILRCQENRMIPKTVYTADLHGQEKGNRRILTSIFVMLNHLFTLEQRNITNCKSRQPHGRLLQGGTTLTKAWMLSRQQLSAFVDDCHRSVSLMGCYGIWEQRDLR